ncbi:MAG TPA: SCO family protein [Bryobacteraceae bacterium]|nr:SCO family protein [Bryobacteraceae bacterium]
MALGASVADAGGADAKVQPIVPPALQGIRIDQKLNAQVPMGAQFIDDYSKPLRLGDLLGKRPAILALVYYTCPMLCDQILRGIVHGLRPLSLVPGRDFDVIAISINPNEGPADAAAKRNEIVKLYSLHASGAGWHFLTGSQENIHEVTDAVGFHYRFDPKSKMFFHAAGIMALTPEGKAARYFYGVEFEPKDLKLGLIESSHNRIGTPVDQLLLFCSHYDATNGKYTTTVLGAMRLTTAGFLVLLIGGLAWFWRREALRR